MRKLNVLFVDDEPFTLHSMESLLLKQPYGKFFARSGREALEILAKQPIHIIIADMKMPGIDGLKLLTMVKDMYPDIIRMVISGYTQYSQLIPCINHGEVFRFITKPLHPEELKGSINEAIVLFSMRAEKEELLQSLKEKNMMLSRALAKMGLFED